METKINKWIALTLGFISPVFGFLYIRKGLWSILSIPVVLFVLYADISGFAKAPKSSFWGYISYYQLVNFIGAFYIFKMSENINDTENVKVIWYRLPIISTMLILTIIAMIIINIFFLEIVEIPTSSMEPTVSKNSLVVIKKWGFGRYGVRGNTFIDGVITTKITRGDIIVFQSQKLGDTRYLKRVIGLPDDTIQFKNGNMLLNNTLVKREQREIKGNFSIELETLHENLHYNVKILTNKSIPINRKWIIPKEQLFVMGDFRDKSIDSRVWGSISIESVMGKVIIYESNY